LPSIDHDLCPTCRTPYVEEGPIGDHWVRSCEAPGLDDLDDEAAAAAMDAHTVHHWDARTGEVLSWVIG